MATSRFTSVTPGFPKPPSLAGLRPRRTTYDKQGREMRPLAGPEIPIPTGEDEEQARRYDTFSQTHGGSVLEFLCYEYLTRTKKQIEGVDFLFQYPVFGGRTVFGGFVLDFLILERKLGWNPLGARWHTLFAPDRARDRMAKVMLENRGIHMVYMFETDLLTRPTYVLDAAWEGEEVGLALGYA